jgi:hypothetical protein
MGVMVGRRMEGRERDGSIRVWRVLCLEREKRGAFFSPIAFRSGVVHLKASHSFCSHKEDTEYKILWRIEWS